MIVLGGLSFKRVQARIKTGVAEALELVLQAAQESLNIWVEYGKFQLNQLVGEPRLASMVKRQLKVAHNKKNC